MKRRQQHAQEMDLQWFPVGLALSTPLLTEAERFLDELGFHPDDAGSG